MVSFKCWVTEYKISKVKKVMTVKKTFWIWIYSILWWVQLIFEVDILDELFKINTTESYDEVETKIQYIRLIMLAILLIWIFSFLLALRQIKNISTNDLNKTVLRVVVLSSFIIFFLIVFYQILMPISFIG